MNIMIDILSRYQKNPLHADFFFFLRNYFSAHEGLVFLLKRNGDPSMKMSVNVRILKSYSRHVVVETLNKNGSPVYRSSISYAALLDDDNSQRLHEYELQKSFAYNVSVIKV